MKKVFGKILPMLLVTCLLIALMPSFILAMEEVVCEVDGVGYVMLEDALDAVLLAGGGSIKLLQNINYNSGIQIDGVGITFKLDGFILNVVNNNGSGLQVINGGDVEYIDAGTTGSFNVIGTEYGVYAENGSIARVSSVASTGYSREATAFLQLVVHQLM